MKILFPDTSSIDHMESVELRQGEVRKRPEPVIVPEYPWEDIYTYLYGSVLKRGPLYRMWYQSYVDGYGFFVNYARSTDGIQWQKPLKNKFTFEQPGIYPTVALDNKIQDFYSRQNSGGSYRTNIVSTYHIPSVIHDAGDKKSPYKLFGYTDNGFCAAFSRDGIHFREYEHNPVIPLMTFPNTLTNKIWFSDVAPAFKDSVKNRFVAFVKTYIIDDQGRTRRCVGFSESDDFKTWSNPETIWVPGPSEDALAMAKGFKWADYYGLCGFNYGDAYLGFLWLFSVDHEVERGTHDGRVEIYLAHSDDCRSWKRLSDEPLISLSRGGWDSDMIYTANAPVFLKDKILVYYGGSNFSHGVGHEGMPYDLERHGFKIGVAEVRKEGFAYAHSSSGGYIITKPVIMRKGELRLNLDASGGRIAVNIMKGNESAAAFDINKINSTDYSLMTGVKGVVALKIILNNAKLYSLDAL